MAKSERKTTFNRNDHYYKELVWSYEEMVAEDLGDV